MGVMFLRFLGGLAVVAEASARQEREARRGAVKKKEMTLFHASHFTFLTLRARLILFSLLLK